MDIKTKIFFIVVALGIVFSVYLSYQRTIVARDFETIDSEAEEFE